MEVEMTDDQSQFKSVTYATCAPGGKNTAGSGMERECPLKPERIARSTIRACRKAAAS